VAAAVLGAGVLSGLALTAATPAGATTTTSQTFTYSGSPQTFTVPTGVTSIHVTAVGAIGGSGAPAGSGGGDGSAGAEVQTTLSVSPGEKLIVNVGGAGGSGSLYTGFDSGGFPTGGSGGAGGYNGGGTGGIGGGGGGGASDIQTGSSLGSRLVVAGGGGGGGGAATGSIAGNGGGGYSTAGGSGATEEPSGYSDAGGGASGGTAAGGAGGSASTGPGGNDGIAGASGVQGTGGDGGSGCYGGGGGGGGNFGGGGGGAFANCIEDTFTGSVSASGAGGGGGGGSNLVGGTSPTINGPSPTLLQEFGGNGGVIISWNAGVAPTITSADTTTFTVGTAGSFQVSATGTPTPTFTESGTLPNGVTFSSTGVLSGTPASGTGGSYPITITASNGVTPNATQDFTLVVDQAPAITSAGTTTFTVGTAGSFQVSATGIPSPTFTESGTLPNGVTFSSTGVLSGTPASGTGGSYAITITASNGVTPNATQTFTLVVDQAPTITSADTTTFTVGHESGFYVATGGYPDPSLSESGTLPKGVTFSSTGLLSGTPASGTGGSYPITITASNGVTPNATQDFTLVVDQAPAITSAGTTTFTVGTAGSFQVSATGIPSPTFAESGTLPKGVTFSSAGLLSGTPASGTGGSYPITITASNGVTPNATQTFTLVVDQAPAITSADTTTFTVGTAGSFQVSATGTPSPTFTESGTLPKGVTFSSTGVLSGTPAAGSAVDNIITIFASNGVSPRASQNFTLVVGVAPVITSADTTTFSVGHLGILDVTATGVPNPTFSLQGAPSWLTLNATSGGLFGTPPNGSEGTYHFTITASNGATPNATQDFTLVVGQSPTITSADTTTFTVGTAGSFQVTATGTPTPITFTETGPLPKGVTFSSTGLLSGTPASGTKGGYFITITASNGLFPNATQDFNLVVDQAPTITSADTTTFTVGHESGFYVATSGYPDPSLSESGTLPSGVTAGIGPVIAGLFGTPAPGTGGSYPITFTASNGVAPDAVQHFTLVVDQAPAITSADTTTFTVGTAGSFDVTSSGYPAATYSLSGTVPSWLSLDATTGMLSGTPPAGSGGSYPFTVTASNGVSPDATQAFTLVVDQAPTITSADSATFTVGQSGSFRFAATGNPPPTFTETGTLPNGVSLSSSGLLSGTPAKGTAGTYGLVITASNTFGGTDPTATQAFTLIVRGPTTTTTSTPVEPTSAPAPPKPPAPPAPAPAAPKAVPTAAKIITGPPQAPFGHSRVLPIGLAIAGVALGGLGIDAARRRRRRRAA